MKTGTSTLAHLVKKLWISCLLIPRAIIHLPRAIHEFDNFRATISTPEAKQILKSQRDLLGNLRWYTIPCALLGATCALLVFRFFAYKTDVDMNVVFVALVLPTGVLVLTTLKFGPAWTRYRAYHKNRCPLCNYELPITSEHSNPQATHIKCPECGWSVPIRQTNTPARR